MQKNLANENAELKEMIENLVGVFSKVEYFLSYIKLINLINKRDLAVKKKKDTALSRKYVDITYENFLELVKELIPGAAEQKAFESFLKVFELVEFKRKNTSTQSTIMLTIGDKQVKGCAIQLDKYTYALNLMGEVSYE